MLETKNVALIGAGVMAEVIARGLIKSKLVEPLSIVVTHHRPERLDELQSSLGVATTSDNAEAFARSDVAVLCVRPQAMGTVLDEIAPLASDATLTVTIAAGLPIGYYEHWLGTERPFVRAMPTFFGGIKAGTTGLSLNGATSADDLAVVSRLFDTISDHVIVMAEEEMDAFTTFGSTTTATVYVLLDALITAGSLVGLRHHASRTRAIEQVVAAAQNIVASDKQPSQLLDEICTPGGVTVEGVKVLEERAMRGIVIDGILAATNRARDLGRGSNER